MFRSGTFLLFFASLMYLVLKTGAVIPKIKYKNLKNPYDPGLCNSLTEGGLRMVKDRNDIKKLLLCIQQTSNKGTKGKWKMMANSGNSYGNIFDPATDCSSILDRIPDAKNGVYWIKTENDLKKAKAWCDMVTDGGGFMLIGVQNSSRTMDVPSDPTLVHPLKDLRHWSSAFGGKKIFDFRVQIATSKSWSDTKADWYYRFNTPRELSNLLLFNDGNCDNQYPGIGDVEFVKDLQNNSVVTNKFECSRFGSHFHKSVGWGKMNECFSTPCKTGFNWLKLANTGTFSVENTKSGIKDTSTKFIGCGQRKCCVCYGPSSDKDYCAPGCKSINGGTVLTDDNNTEIHAWYWVRTSLPKRVWKKCMEYEKTNEAGKIVKWHIDGYTNVPKKGPCSYPGDVKLNEGVAVVDDKKSLQKLPNLGGLLSYRSDNGELYLRGRKSWKVIAEKKQVEEVETKVQDLRYETQTLKNKVLKELAASKAEIYALSKNLSKQDNELKTQSAMISKLSKKLLKLEQEKKIYTSCKNAFDILGTAINGAYKIKDPSHSEKYTNTYCHMTSLPGCSGGGWTLVMKLNGKKETFNYDSNYWSNKASYNLGGGLTAFDDQETKLPTYWNTPFKELCLGMKVKNDLNFISISHQASSLYDVIASGSYRSTSIGRSKWLSLVQGSRLQPNCNLEGFNVKSPNPGYTNLQIVRIGILGNEQNNCRSPDSYFGFGGLAKNRRGQHCEMPTTSNTCGNAVYCNGDTQDVEILSMGYIFVR